VQVIDVDCGGGNCCSNRFPGRHSGRQTIRSSLPLGFVSIPHRWRGMRCSRSWSGMRNRPTRHRRVSSISSAGSSIGSPKARAPPKTAAAGSDPAAPLGPTAPLARQGRGQGALCRIEREADRLGEGRTQDGGEARQITGQPIERLDAHPEGSGRTPSVSAACV